MGVIMHLDKVAGGGGGGSSNPATADELGIVKPDGITTQVDENGVLSTVSPQEDTAAIEDTEYILTEPQKKKPLSTLWTWIKNKIDAAGYLTEHQDISGKVDNSAAGANSLIGQMPIWTADPTDNCFFIRQDTGGGDTNNSFGKVKFSTLWNYIKSKAQSFFLPLSGGTMTGNLNLKPNQYDRQGALNCGNSDIIGINSLYTADNAENSAEGLRFYRDASHWDSLTASGGVLYFAPNDPHSGTAFSGCKKVAMTSDIPTSLPANGGTSSACSGNAATATYTTILRGVQTNGTAYGDNAGNNVQAVWNVKSDSRWYLKAGTYNCRVGFADSAANHSGFSLSGTTLSITN